MSVSKIEALREQRRAAFEDMQKVLERTDENGDLAAEDAQEFDRREADFDRLDESIQRMEKVEGLAPKANVQTLTAAEAREVEKTIEERREPAGVESREYHDAFEAFVRRGFTHLASEQRAALQYGTDSEGGYTVADEWYRQLVESEREYGIVQSLATTFQTAESGTVNVPTVASNSSAVLTAEEAGFTQSEPTFGNVAFDAFKYGIIMKVSDELLHDSIFDIAAFMAKNAGQALAVVTGTAFATGDGSSKPNGIFTAASTGVTAASATAITADELIDLYHSVLSPYRDRASWILKDATLKAVRKLKDGESRYLWQPSIQVGVPDTLLGRPVYTDPNAPAATTGLDSVLFGDVSAYWIRQVGTVTVKRLEELYAANGQVGFRVDKRVDGDLVDSSAVKVLTQA